MSRVFPASPHDAERGEALRAAASALRRGELVVLPTETVYGIACRPDDPEATDRLFAAKRRPTSLNLPVLAHTARDAWGVAVPDGRAERLAAAFWPGPLTVVLPRAAGSRDWNLGQDPATVAVRVPDHAMARALLEMVGPLAVTSANISGHPPATDIESARAAFGEAVEVYLEGPVGEGTPSTVVDLTAAGPVISRPGALDGQALTAALGEPLARPSR